MGTVIENKEGMTSTINENEDRLCRFVSTEMIRIGFVPSLKGFRYFRDLLMSALSKGTSDNLMTLYSTVAERLQIKASVLERNVRTLISSSFIGSRFHILTEYFGLPDEKYPPTVGQTLALMTEFIATRLLEIGDTGGKIPVREADARERNA